MGAIMAIYNELNDKNKQFFQNIVLKNEYKFARFLDKMWSWVS